MSLEELISTYGYVAIILGTFLEGETILILGGLSAARGYLSLEGVIACAFFGTLLGDQLFYYIGRFKGKSWIESKPKWKSKADKISIVLERHQNVLILGFRFVYGIRTITPFIIGASGIRPLRFLILNIIGGMLWASIIGSLGYVFGQAFEVFIGDVKKYEAWLFGFLALLGVMIWFLSHLRKPAAGKK